MQAWKGWMAKAVAPTAGPPTWAEWRARQQDALRNEQRRQQGMPFSEQGLARLSFVRWLCQTGRLDP